MCMVMMLEVALHKGKKNESEAMDGKLTNLQFSLHQHGLYVDKNYD